MIFPFDLLNSTMGVSRVHAAIIGGVLGALATAVVFWIFERLRREWRKRSMAIIKGARL